ncbi:restriction endonuclease subunit S [Citrobacter werkmanii]|uniref:restriction endonuclease subunit S n=1 Tax=Citrobacter werkmanii TaxID=67827 RepID=UPI003F8D820A
MNLPIYGRYTKSNILWVGNYPSEWFITKVKYEAYVKARVGWHGLKSDDFTDEGPFLVTGSDFKSSRIQWADCYHCDLNRYEQDPYIQLRNGDLLITKDGTIGKVALVDGLKTNEKATLNSGVFVVRPLINNFSTRFYFWLLQSKVFTDFVDYNKTGSTIVHLYQDTFVNFSYASPQLKEQIQIAAFLDHETAKIDNLIEKQQQLIELLKEKRQAVIRHAVTKGLNPDAPMKDSGVEWLGGLPSHWQALPTKRLFRLVAEPAEINNDYELLSVYTAIGVAPRKDLEPKGNKASTTDGYWKVRQGDIIVNKLLAWMGAVGFSNYDGVTSPAYDILRKVKDINPRFYHYLFRLELTQREFKRWSRGIMEMRLRLYFEELGRIIMPVPPRQEQDVIVEEIEKIEHQYSQLETITSHQIALLQERRTALISAAVTGKIDVRDWVAPDTQDIEEPQEATA